MPNLSALVIAALFCIVCCIFGIWMIVEGETAGWFILLLSPISGTAGVALFIFNRREAILERESEGERIQLQKERKAQVEEHRKLVATNDIDVPENPIDVWKNILIEEGADWVVFENGTLVICEEGKPAEESALEIIGEFTETIAGTSLGDFSVNIRPEFGIWVITYPGNRVCNYIELKSCTSDSAAGMIARVVRSRDATEKNIVHMHLVDAAEAGG